MAEPRIFISYSHKDREWLLRLQAHLGVLRQEGLVAAWSDENLRPGDDWPHEIRAALDSADIAVLLVSANFLDSTFIREKEMPVLLERREAGTLKKIVPLVVTPCPWQLWPYLKGIEIRPKHRDSVARGNAAEQEGDLADLTAEIARLLATPGPVTPTGPGTEVELPEPGVTLTRPRDSNYAILEVRLDHREWDRYTVELSLSHSGGVETPRPLSHRACFDVPSLLRICDPLEHGRRLYDLLFPEQPQRDLVRKAREAAQDLGIPLRLRIAVNACARELHCLRWELLTHGTQAENPLSFESTSFVRYAGADPRSWRTIQRRPRARLRAVLAAGLTDWFDSSVPPASAADSASAELERARGILEACGVETANSLGYLSPEALKSELRAKTSDILYLCVDLPMGTEAPKGGSTSAAWWWSRLGNLPLAGALRELETPPRLVVLCPILRGDRSATANAVPAWLPILREADELAQTGVIGVLTTQGPMDGAAWHAFLTTFLRTLGEDGRLDLAVHTARLAIAVSGQQWLPVLISGLRSARIWYVPRFTEKRNAEAAWQTLLRRIEKGVCTPIVGPALNATVAWSRAKIALSLADTYNYPMAFHERVSLPQVAQYVASEYGEDFFYEQYESTLRDFTLKRYGALLSTEDRRLPLDRLVAKVVDITLGDDANEPHNILAALPFRLYITASLNSFLGDALRRARGRQPQEAVLGFVESPGASSQLRVEPSPEQPLVYHLFGRLSALRNSVITEDNYFDFLIHFWKEKEVVPKVIRAALTDSSLLFLGFKMHEWDFRVLCRTLLAQEGSRRRTRHMHVAVQIDPDDDQVVDPERARVYLEHYFSREFVDADINVYWGSAEDFLQELKRRWDGFRG